MLVVDLQETADKKPKNGVFSVKKENTVIADSNEASDDNHDESDDDNDDDDEVSMHDILRS